MLDNHNLSKEIHRMMPPDLDAIFLSRFSDVDKDILDILEKNRSTFFRHLKEHYEIDNTLAKIEEECNALYPEYKKAKDDANEYERKELEPAKGKFKEAERKHDACQRRIEELKKGIEEAKGADRNKIEEMRKELQEAKEKLGGLWGEKEKTKGARLNYCI